MYLSFNDPASSPGVFRKEREFCKFLGEAGKERGIEFKGLCIVTSKGRNRENLSFGEYLELRRIPSLSYKIFSRVPLFGSIFRIRPTYTEAYQEISSYRPDAIIWRFTITSVPGIFDPKKVHPKACFISEHQAKEIEELRMTAAGRIAAPIIRRKRDEVLRNVDAVIGVTDEITRYELAVTGRNILSFTMTNSIDVDSYPIKYTTYIDRGTLQLLYVGSHTADWQGLDRLLKGMAAYRGDTQVVLHVAGNMGTSTRHLIDTLGIGSHVHVHGYVEGKDLDMLFDACDIAIGTLGMHRKNLTHGSTLKVREYMARGMPFMISYTDEDLQPGLPYVHMPPADDSPIDMEGVIGFTRETYSVGGPDMPHSMRAYAREHMDCRAKTIKLLDFIESLLRQS